MAIITDPDWIDPEETTFDVEKPIRSEQGVMLAGNPIAIALGKPGAPKVEGKALDIDIGNLSGTTAIVGLGDCAKLLLVAQAQTSSQEASTTATIGYQRTSNGGSSWGSGAEIARATTIGSENATAGAQASGAVIVDMVGYDGIRLSGTGTLSGAAIWVEGV